MKIIYYLHGLKWKDDEVTEQKAEQGFVAFHVFDNPNYLKNTETEYVEVRVVRFELEEIYEHIPFKNLPYHDVLQFVQFSREGNSSHRIEYQGHEIMHVNANGEYITLRGIRAVCNDPHIFINSKGELAYREIEVEVQPVRLMRVRKTLFDIIDLE